MKIALTSLGYNDLFFEWITVCCVTSEESGPVSVSDKFRELVNFRKSTGGLIHSVAGGLEENGLRSRKSGFHFLFVLSLIVNIFSVTSNGSVSEITEDRGGGFWKGGASPTQANKQAMCCEGNQHCQSECWCCAINYDMLEDLCVSVLLTNPDSSR